MLSQTAQPPRDGSYVIFVSEVGSVPQGPALKKCPDFQSHFCLNCCTDEKGMGLEFVFGERLVNPIESCAGCLPMFIGTSRVNAAF